jgi:hypothetical protein
LKQEAKAMKKTKTSFVGFHGTQELFEAFNTPAWFSNTFDYAEKFASYWGSVGDRTEFSRVIVAVLEISNPYYTSDWDVTEPQNKDVLKNIQAAGYDGVVFTSPECGQEVEYIVFRADQIRQVASVSVAKQIDNVLKYDENYSLKPGM